MTNDNKKDSYEIITLCNTVKDMISHKKYLECDELIVEAMAKYPHAPEPHNLMGIKLENEGDHLTAMKHFRAAWSLDPTYLPARYNMNQYADMFARNRKDAYVEDDCPVEQDVDLYEIEYDKKGIRHTVKKKL